MAEGSAKIEGKTVVLAEIPQSDVQPQEVTDFLEKVPGAEVETEEAKPGKPPIVRFIRNFIRIKK